MYNIRNKNELSLFIVRAKQFSCIHVIIELIYVHSIYIIRFQNCIVINKRVVVF